MSESEKNKSATTETGVLSSSAAGPLVFISHDSRDADLADAVTGKPIWFSWNSLTCLSACLSGLFTRRSLMFERGG